MDESWTRLSELFEAARGLPADQREAWVRSHSADARVSAEILALLQTYEEDPAFLEGRVPADVAGAALAAVSQPIEGRRLGRYRLVREVGRGGMGVVYEAEHTDAEFSRRVAIKLVPSGWSASSLVARFRYERRVLARLDHPGIARLLDADTTDEGTPYFVMEFVDGQPIDVWCRERALTIRQRIELILRVSEAVDHAHRNLVVHRDLKAANILIAPDGQPKLLDFGIAKMLSDEADLSGGLTAAGQAAFTPSYASPEQIRGEGVTTASDVYSLGVLLYLLLTERLPYEIAGLSPFDAMRTVCDTEPPTPSAVAPLAWRPTLQGDIDNVLLKALRKDPRERYPSVRAMADDLVAWRDGHPVSASRATLWYRARKFAVRRKAQAAAAAAVALALVAGGAATAWQAHVAGIERDKAESRFRQVRQFSRSLLFELHDSIRGLPGSTPARQLLLSRAVQFLDGLANDAGGDQALKLELAEGYRKLGQVQGSSFSENLGDTTGAVASFEKAARLGEDVLAREPRSVAAAILLTGAYDDLTNTLVSRGDVDAADRADRLHRAVVEQLERTNAKDAVVQASLASSYSNLAYFRGVRRDWPEAKALYTRSISLHEALPPAQRALGNTIRSYAFALKRLGAILVSEGNLEDGERRYQAALAVDEQIVALHPDSATYRYDMTFSLTDLAVVAKRRRDFARAESLWNRALAIREAALAADPKNTRAIDGVANIRVYLGDLYLTTRRFPQAVSELRDNLRLRDQLVTIRGPLPQPIRARASAQLNLAQALLDSAEAERPGGRRAALVSEAGRWLTLAEPVARKAAADSSPNASNLLTLVEQQTARLGRLGGRP